MTHESRLPAIGFIGLGTMGYPMARRLADAGYPLRVFDINGDAVQRFSAEASCEVAASVAEAARGVQVLITMLPSSREVDAALLGVGDAPGALDSLAKGSLVVDMSSSDPLRTRELAARVAAAGCALVDAPVSGALKRALNGTLAIMVGGAPGHIDACRPILERLGTSVFHCGEVGTGHAMKALNNYVSAAGLVAAVEALHTGRRFGIDPLVMTRVLNASTGKNNTTENKVEQFMLSGTFGSGFFLRLMAKDVGIAVDLARRLGADAGLATQCGAIWARAAAAVEANADHTEMYRLLDPDAGLGTG